LPWHLPSKWLDQLQDKLPGNLSARYVAAGAAVVIVALLVLVLGGGEPQQVATADRTVTLPLSGSSQADEVVAVESPAGRSSPVGEAAPVEETVAGSTQNPTRAADQPAASSPAVASATPESDRPAAGGAAS